MSWRVTSASPTSSRRTAHDLRHRRRNRHRCRPDRSLRRRPGPRGPGTCRGIAARRPSHGPSPRAAAPLGQPDAGQPAHRLPPSPSLDGRGRRPVAGATRSHDRCPVGRRDHRGRPGPRAVLVRRRWTARLPRPRYRREGAGRRQPRPAPDGDAHRVDPVRTALGDLRLDQGRTPGRADEGPHRSWPARPQRGLVGQGRRRSAPVHRHGPRG